jgi:hypothetical protein
MPPGAAMRIVVNDQVHLSEFRSSDKDALIEHLNDQDIYERTLRIPFPYTEAAADEWLALYAKTTEKHGQPAHFAIRTGDDALLSGCGLTNGSNVSWLRYIGLRQILRIGFDPS